MLFHVRMDVRIPHDMDPEVKADLVAREKAYAQEVQESGRWPHLWRIVGEYANVSIFDVESNDVRKTSRRPTGDVEKERTFRLWTGWRDGMNLSVERGRPARDSYTQR